MRRSKQKIRIGVALKPIRAINQFVVLLVGGKVRLPGVPFTSRTTIFLEDVQVDLDAIAIAVL